MTRLTVPALLAIGILSVGALVGCATGTASSPTADDTPDATASASPSEVQAGWLDAGRGIAVVTLGSSSCVPTASDPVLTGGTLTITLAETTEAPCTRDMAPRATFVALPSDVDPTKNVDIVVTGAISGSTSLAGLATSPAPVAEFAPSAGWVGPDIAAILTWGSSGCRPQVEAVTSDAGGATVTFAEPPADQVCTMDLAPRVALADLTGIVGAGAVELTLVGGNVASDGPLEVLGQR
ncbi:hypothetical protein [Microbacterium sp. B19]|uniref:hypothetical protein n=1 Tax=Microbacterium sp. B19 TaxID=96765 RepID=UPI00034BA666|nr:hypothetical protein [Microbacterium sp. B19]